MLSKKLALVREEERDHQRKHKKIG